MIGSSSSAMSTEPSKLLSMRVSQSCYGSTIPWVLGRTRVSGNLLWFGDWTAVRHEERTSSGGKGGGGSAPATVSYTYTASLLVGVASQQIAGVPKVWLEKSSYTPDQLGFELLDGALGQPRWAHLLTHHPDEADAYSGIAMLGAVNYDLGEDGSTPQWSFEVIGQHATHPSGDAWPDDIVREIWTNAVEGAGLDVGGLSALDDYALWCRANDFSLSLAMETQQPARQYVQDVLDATLCVAVPTSEGCRIVPLGDTAVGDWAPQVEVRAYITEDDLLDGDPPVITRKPQREATNRIQLEYWPRSQDYNATTITWSDVTAVNQWGAKTETRTLHAITREAMAGKVAAATGQRSLNIRATGSFKVGGHLCYLEPMDIVELDFAAGALSGAALRITSIEEDEDGSISLEVEEWPFAVSQPADRGVSSGSGYVPDYNTAPGATTQHAIFEPPVSLAGAPQIWIGAGGGDQWGGCEVWVSLDGDTYSRVGQINAAARIARLTGALPIGSDPDETGVLALQLSRVRQQIIAVSESARDLGESLMWLSGADGGELVAYRDALLTAPGAYRLSGLRRGLHGTRISAHGAGAQALRCDDALLRYTCPADLVGRTLYIKLRAFNVMGAAHQDLSECEAIAYAVAGAPVGQVSGFRCESWGSSLSLVWNALEGASSYVVSLATHAGDVITRQTTDCRITLSNGEIAEAGGARVMTARITGYTATSHSEPASISLARAQLPAPTVALSPTNAGMIVSVALSDDAAYAATRVVVSQKSDFAPEAGQVISDSPQTIVSSPRLARGTWYVRAAQYDTLGDDSLNWSSPQQTAVEVLDGVQTVADASAITAEPGSDAPGGDAYWAVLDTKTGKMAAWDKASGRYTLAPSEGEVTAAIAAAVAKLPTLGAVQDLDAGLKAEAAARAKSDADEAAARAAALLKEAQDRAAAVAAEANARADAVAAEANARATQLLQEKLAREAAITTTQQLQQSADQSLAAEIAQVAAGTGQQFDAVRIWYFNAELDGWSGSTGQAQIIDGWLRPAPGNDPYEMSPTGLGIDASAYRFVKARLRRVGTPAWEGALLWTSGVFDFAGDRRKYIAEPLWSADGTATVSWDDIPWLAAGTINQIRLDCTTACDAANYIEIDWVAIGRPTPGAGVAALESVRQAMVAGDAANALKSDLLAAQLRGDYSGTDSGQLTQGLLYDVRKTAVDLAGAEATKREALAAEVAGKASSGAVQALETRVQATELQTTSQGGAITQLQGEVGKQLTWILRSAGLGADHGPWLGCPKTGASYPFSRSYNMLHWADDGSVASFQTYDVFGGGGMTSGRDGNALAADIQALPHGALVAIVTFDEPSSNITAVMLDAIESLGGTRSLLTSLPYRGAYLLVGRKGFGPGSAVEKVATVGGATNAWVEYTLQFVDGRPLGIDGAAGARAVQTGQATALESLSQKVSQQDGELSAQSGKITQLQGSVQTAQDTANKKADSSAIESLSQKVTQQDGTLNAQAEHLQQLDAHVGTAQDTANSAVQQAQSAQATANGKASAERVSALEAISQHTHQNLIDYSSWRAGAMPPSANWAINANSGADGNEMVLMPGPHGAVVPVWRSVGRQGEGDGGWNYANNIPVSDQRSYRVSVWMRHASGSATMFFGPTELLDLGGGSNWNPYFCCIGSSDVAEGRWYLFVGYIYPAGYTGAGGASGVWDGTTGEKVFNGTDFKFAAGQATTGWRAYQYYGSEGCEQHFALPRVDEIDGSEPSIAALLSGAVLGQLPALSARITAAETASATRDAALAQRASAIEATVNSEGSGLAATRAKVAEVEKAASDAAGANASSIREVSASLGATQTAVQQVTSSVAATQQGLANTWTLVQDSAGKISYIRSQNDGRESVIQLSADKIILGDVTNLVPNGKGESLDGWNGGAAIDFGWGPWGITAPNRALVCSARDTSYRWANIPVTEGEQLWCEFDSVPDGGQTNLVNQDLCFYLFDAQGNVVGWPLGARRPAGTAGGYHASGVMTVPAGVVSASLFMQIEASDNFTAPGYRFYATNIVVRKRMTTKVFVPGSVTVEVLAAEAITAVSVQAQQGVFDKLATKVIAAINAAVETITAVRMELIGSDWSFIRTSGKWLADGVSGFISAARPSTGDFFQEFMCSSGLATILSRRSGGPNVRLQYRERVVDAAGKELLDIGIEGGQAHARFGGEVVGVSGTFGEVTAGLMRNSDSSASVNLSAVGDQVFARWGGEDRIWANGRTRFSSLLISGNWASLGLVAANVGRIGSVASGGYSYIKDVGGSVTIDTGIPIDSLPWHGGYEDCYFVTVSGFSIDSTLQSLLNSTGSRLCLSARVAYQMPTAAGETWGNVTLKVIVEASFCPAITLPDSTMRATVLSAVINVKRAS